MFEELTDWEVRAVRAGEPLSFGYFRQTHPEDAVLLLMVIVRAKFGVPMTAWDAWTFWCISRTRAGEPRQTLVFEISPDGRPLRLADSRQGGFLQPGRESAG